MRCSFQSLSRTQIAIAALTLATGSAPARPHEDHRCRIRHFAAAGGQLAYRSCGSGEAVVIVPGGPGLDTGYMQEVADTVSQAGFRAILFEPRGTGASRAARGDGRYLTVSGSIADLEALRRALDAPRLRLLGHSFGSAMAQAYAQRYPARVRQLILMNAVGPDLRPAPYPLDSWRQRLSSTELERYDAARTRGDRITAMRIKFVGGFANRHRGEAFVARLDDAAIHLDLQPLADAYAADYAITRPVTAFPVTVIAGEVDWIRGHEPALRKIYPRARWLVVPDAGHFPWVDAPALAARVLVQALRERQHPHTPR